MSLAQHVTSIEGFDRNDLPWAARPEGHQDESSLAPPDDEDADKLTWHRLSFDAFRPDDMPDIPLAVPHTAAYKISDARRALQVITAVIACVMSSGILFGFAALKPVLIAEGVYAELCHDGLELISSPLPPPPLRTNIYDDPLASALPCAEQDLRLNLFFIVGSITTNVSALLAGTLLDRFGRRTCYVLAAAFLAAASVMMGCAFAIPEFDGYLVANILLGLGGTFIFVPSFELANAFPKHSGVVCALVTGAFDASAAVYLFYRMAYEATDGAFSPQIFFFTYAAVVPPLLLLAEWAYMPAGAYHTTPELEQKIEKVQDRTRDVHVSDDEITDDAKLHNVRSSRAEARMAKLDAIEDLVGDAEEREERVRYVEERLEVSGVWGVLHGLPAHRQMLTPWFMLLLLLTVVQMLRMNYFIATIHAQYGHMLGDDHKAEDITLFFDVVLPIGGVVATPFIGALLNNVSVGTMCALVTGFIVLLGVLNCLPYLWAGYATVVVFVLFRPLYYSAISDFATKIFGFATFGRIYGTITCLCGLVNFVQSALDALTHGPLGGDPTPVNATMGAVGVLVGAVLTAYVVTKSGRFREVVKEERPAEGRHASGSGSEQDRLIPEDAAVEYGTA